MSERDRSFNADNSNYGKSYLGLSQMNSKQLVQSHLKSIMPSLKGGKQEDDVKYIFLRVHENLESRLQLGDKLTDILNDKFGSYYEYKRFSKKSDLLSETIKEGDLYYILVGEDLSSWAQKFSRQERDESNDKRIIHVVEFLKSKKYSSRVKDRKELRRDPNEHIFYEANLDGDYMETLNNAVIMDMEDKLKVRLKKEGDKVKSWALTNKFKAKDQKKNRLFLYVEKSIMDSLSKIYHKNQNNSRFHYTKFIPFTSFKEILMDLKQRDEANAREYDLYRSMRKKMQDGIVSERSLFNEGSRLLGKSSSNIMASNINLLERSRSYLKSGSNIGVSTLSPSKSVKDISLQKLDTNPLKNEYSYVICYEDHEEIDKLYQFILGQKEDTWKLIEYSEKNAMKIQNQVREVMKSFEKDADEDEYQRILKAKTLFIISEEGDYETGNNFLSLNNHFCNMEHLVYEDSESLEWILNAHGRDMDNFLIIVLRDQSCNENDTITAFIDEHQSNWELNNLKRVYKMQWQNESVAMGLSTNSKLGYAQTADDWLKNLMEERDRHFHPFSGLAGRNVYLLYRYDKEEFIDAKMRERIAKTRRLQKATYRDGNYLHNFLRTLKKKKDSAIVITDDSVMWEAQKVVKEFDDVFIMNITDRQKVKDEVKVMAWGTKEQIYDLILKEIPQVEDRLERKEYRPEDKVGWAPYERHDDRIMPKEIMFKNGNNITVRLSENEQNIDSTTMENNLDSYFSEEIRFEYYGDPKEIRLVNKVEQPLTFIICRDDKNQLDYMKKIAKQQRDDLRQQYILYTKKNPNSPEFKDLREDPKYSRFRFISSSWEEIEKYIIGAYQGYRGIVNEQIYENELVHVFYHPEDAEMVRYFKEELSNQPVWSKCRFYPVEFMEEIALEQSPHHLYYLVVNEKNPRLNTDMGRQEILRVQEQHTKRRIPQKKIEMLVYNPSQMVRKQDHVKGTFEDYKAAMNFVAQTKVLPTRIRSTKPHIIINDKAADWYYFLNKFEDTQKYHFHFVDKKEDAVQLIRKIRTIDPENGMKSTKSAPEYAVDPGAVFWFLTNNKQDLTEAYNLSTTIENGRDIHMLYHGGDHRETKVPLGKILFADSNRQQVQSFILNMFKRSHTRFSPDALRVSGSPVLAMSQQTRDRVPLSSSQLARWQQDLGLKDYCYFDDINQLRKQKYENRTIYLVQDINEDPKNYKAIQNLPNVFRILFDSNERDRKKSHDLRTMLANKKDIYTGYYPAEVRNYLTNLRYNIKHPPFKLAKKLNKQLIQVYMERGLDLSPADIKRLKTENHSLVFRDTFDNNYDDLQRVLRDAKRYPGYETVLLVGKEIGQIIEGLPQKDEITYIIYDEMFRMRNLPKRSLDSEYNPNLVSDQKEEIVTYFYNLPEKRYEKAQSLRQPLKVMYENDAGLDDQANQLRRIAKRSKAFTVDSYNKIDDLKARTDNIVVVGKQNSIDEHVRKLGHVENITYFIMDDNEGRNLDPNPKKSEYFITKRPTDELYSFFNNAKIIDRIESENVLPKVSVPLLLQKPIMRSSRPLGFKNVDFSKVSFFPNMRKIPTKPTVKPYRTNNFLDENPKNFFKLPPQLKSDAGYTLRTEQFKDTYIYEEPEELVLAPVPHQALNVALDYPPSINTSKFESVADRDTHSIPPVLETPNPKPVQKKMAVIYPENKEFIQIARVLKSNLSPKPFSTIDEFPYRSDYDFENLSKQKFDNYDRTICFIEPHMRKYADTLSGLKSRMHNKLEYYIFDDDFDQSYPKFVKFLPGYDMRNYSIPYINKEDPEFWLSTNIYNIMVPLNKKKKYDALRSDNVIVMPYTSDQDIINQLHRQDEFVIIICDKKTYHSLKKYPRFSPRCILVVEDNQSIGEDEIPLFRYPKKALYYGSDVINYLSKYRIPSRKIPYKQQNMKVLFFKPQNPAEQEIVSQEDFKSYEKVPYSSNEDLFIKMIERFKSSHNFKLPDKRNIKSLIKLHPKVYMAKQNSYMDKYKNEYSSLDGVQDFKTSFKNEIKPSQYAHLPFKEYESMRDLQAQLEAEQSPCLVYVDVNRREYMKLVKDFKDKHLFIMMHNLLDRWILPNGYLVDSEQLNDKIKLGKKQVLFTRMFSQEVFDTYNDMGYFYLSNSARVDSVRRITFMTKQALIQEYTKKPNLLMIVFVEHTDRKFIPQQFYDPDSDTSKEDRVKLVFIHTEFVDNEDSLYIKYNEIDPVIKHINRVELASRVNYCLYPNSDVGGILWHKFTTKFKGFQPIEYHGLEDINNIAHDIKGKFRKVFIICQKDEENFIQQVLGQYSIKTKPKTEEEVRFLHISQSDQKSFLMPQSRINMFQGGGSVMGIKGSSPMITKDGYLAADNVKTSYGHVSPKSQSHRHPSIALGNGHAARSPKAGGGLKFTDNEDENSQKFETVGQPIDIKMNSSNKNFGNLDIEDVIESKNFVLNVNEKLRDTFPVGNFYASKVTYFKDLDQLEHSEPGQSQLIISNEKYGDIQKIVHDNMDIFVVYVSNEMPSGQKNNTLIIQQKDIPNLIRKLEGSRKQLMERGQQEQYNPDGQGLNLKNIEQYKLIRILYDKNVDKDTKKQIFLTSLKHKNLVPVLYSDMNKLKEYLRDENSLLLFMMSENPPGFEEELRKENYVVVRKKKLKMIVPKRFDSTIDGLSTILEEQHESEISYIDHQNMDLTNVANIDKWLEMIERNPEKGKRTLMKVESGNQIEEEQEMEKESFKGIDHEHENITKLNVHSNIRPENYLDEQEKEKIKHRLDGGVIVVVVEKEYTDRVKDLLRKYNILIQEYSHAINLGQSIRDRKGKVTIVVIKKNMLEDIRKIKQQFPMIIFVLLNPDSQDIPEAYEKYISVEIAKIGELEPIVGDIYEQNEKVKYVYVEQGKLSKMDNRRVSTVEVGNSERFSVGFNNTRAKKAFVFYKTPENKKIIEKASQYLSYISFIPYTDFEDAQKKLNSYGGYQSVLIANDIDIPRYEDYILKKKDQTYIIKLNPSDDLRDNPKVKKNILMSAYSDEELFNFLINRFEKNSKDLGYPSQEKLPEGKRYTQKYQPSAFGTTPRFSSPSNNFVPLKNDPNFSKRMVKSSSRSSKMLRGSETQLRSIDSRANDYSTYFPN